MRFAILAKIVIAAASFTLVAATALERRLPGTCSSSAASSIPFCGDDIGDCSGDGCECTELGVLPDFRGVLSEGPNTFGVGVR